MEWQPIETAPKDGTWIMLSNPAHPVREYRTMIGYYDRDAYTKKPRPYWSIVGIGCSGSRAYQPTHWMPLPELPKED